MQIFTGSDHAGYLAKTNLVDYLKKKGHNVVDAGTNSQQTADYPDYAKKVAEETVKAISTGQKAVGILICGTGIGMCITANKVKGCYAALAYNVESARLAREHNNANVLCLGGKTMTDGMMLAIVDQFLKSSFSQEMRHEKRIEKIKLVEGSS